MIVEDEFFDLRRVGCKQIQEGSLKVCLWTVWTFEKLVDFGSVKRSEAFAGRRKMFVTRTGKSCYEQDLPGGSFGCRFAAGIGIFLMDGFIFKNSWHAIS